MLNSERELLDRKSLQLQAAVAFLAVTASNSFEDLTATELCNFVWMMADLIADMRAVIDPGYKGPR
ncbi:hypothetical protein AAGS40_23370 [Paraburkholderia sp. PREW-6R]|uniref:hypothetical protein n=1 Tax=Paraburkholderia sp. PREW-6R TaxID=3141544 RepID=UPI0031F4DE4E